MFSTYAVYDVLKAYSLIHTVPDSEHRAYKGIYILPPTADMMSADNLYVCFLKEAIERDALCPGCHYVCLADVPTEEADNMLDARNNMFCLPEEVDFFAIFCALNDRFLNIQDWVNCLSNLVLGGCSFQELVDASEEMLKNPVYVQGPAFKLLATTKKYLEPTERHREYRETTYHKADFIKMLEDKGRFRIYNNTLGLFLLNDHAVVPYDIIAKNKHRGGMLKLSIGASCIFTPYSPYYGELMETFCDYVFLCDDINEKKEFRSEGATLINDIIRGVLVNRNQIQDLSRIVSIPFTGPFYLYRIVWNKETDVFQSNLEHELSEALGCAHVFAYATEVLAIVKCENVADDVLTLDASNAVRQIMLTHHCRCAVSEPCADLAALKAAYDQTCYTLSFVDAPISEKADKRMLPNSEENFKRRTLYSYREIFIRSIFNHYIQNGPCPVENVIFVNALRKLIAFDQEHDRNLVEILYYYICNERNASKTGKEIHMSRNNVLYHIAKVVEIIGLPLEEHRIRFGLLVAYNLLGIYF